MLAAERGMFEEIGGQSAELVPPLRELGVFISELSEKCVVFGSHQPEQKGVGLRSKKSATASLQWGRWIPIEAFLEAVKARDAGTKHWLPIRFGKMGRICTDFLQSTVSAAIFAVLQFDSALTRATTVKTQEMLET